MKTVILSVMITCCLQSYCQKTDLDMLNMLTGIWVMEAGTSRIHEVWKKDGSSLSGYSYRVRNNDTTFLETIRLERTDSGVYYRPTVPDQNSGKQVSFKLGRQDNSSFHFINLQHDFPKRIIYSFKGENELEVVIDDAQEVTKKRSVYKFKRATK